MADKQPRVIIDDGKGIITTYSASTLEEALRIKNRPVIKVSAEAVANHDTHVLHQELLKREGVTGIEVEPHRKVLIDLGDTRHDLVGPFRIILNND